MGVLNLKYNMEQNIKWVFPLPAVIFVAVMMAFPLIFTVGISLTDWSMITGGIAKFIGCQNYLTMLKDTRFYNALFNTFYFTIFAVTIETILGVIIALILNREFRGKGFVKTVLLLPMVSTPVAVGLCWTLFYEPTMGLGNYTLKLLGLPALKWLASSNMVIPSIALVDIWEWTPMIALLVLAGFAGLPTEPFEAARVDGATRFQVLRFVTLPLLWPTILTAIILRSIDAFKTFDIILVMTGGGPLYASETLNIYAYKQCFNFFQFGSASATLMMLFVLVLGCSLLTLRLQKNFRER
jgi:multiple sugar transport system permease protein